MDYQDTIQIPKDVHMIIYKVVEEEEEEVQEDQDVKLEEVMDKWDILFTLKVILVEIKLDSVLSKILHKEEQVD